MDLLKKKKDVTTSKPNLITDQKVLYLILKT